MWREADLRDRLEALEQLLLVDDEVDVAVTHGLHRRGREVEAGHVDGVGRKPGGVQVGLGRRRHVAVVEEDGRQVGVRRRHAGEGRDAGRGVGVRGVVDLLVDDLEPGSFERLVDAQRALATPRLALQAPEECLVARLEAAARDGLVGERRSGFAEGGTDVARAGCRVRGLGLWQLGVHDRDDDALRDRFVDERSEGRRRPDGP